MLLASPNVVTIGGFECLTLTTREGKPLTIVTTMEHSHSPSEVAASLRAIAQWLDAKEKGGAQNERARKPDNHDGANRHSRGT